MSEVDLELVYQRQGRPKLPRGGRASDWEVPLQLPAPITPSYSSQKRLSRNLPFPVYSQFMEEENKGSKGKHAQEVDSQSQCP